MELAVIFEPTPLYLELRTQDQTHGLEVTSVCFVEIKHRNSQIMQINRTINK